MVDGGWTEYIFVRWTLHILIYLGAYLILQETCSASYFSRSVLLDVLTSPQSDLVSQPRETMRTHIPISCSISLVPSPLHHSVYSYCWLLVLLVLQDDIILYQISI